MKSNLNENMEEDPDLIEDDVSNDANLSPNKIQNIEIVNGLQTVGAKNVQKRLCKIRETEMDGGKNAPIRSPRQLSRDI